MKIIIANHEFTELWDGVFYKALSDYPRVSDNEMKDIIDFEDKRQAVRDRSGQGGYIKVRPRRNAESRQIQKCAQTEDNTGVYGLCGSRRMHDGSGVPYRSS